MTAESMKQETELTQNEKNLHLALAMTEIGMDLKDRHVSGSKYVSQLKTIVDGAEKAVSGLREVSKSSLLTAQMIVTTALTSSNHNTLKKDCEKLLAVIEQELHEMYDVQGVESELNMSHVTEKIKNLESRQKVSENQCFNLKSIDEKYPENLSKDSLIDLNSIGSLPPVPEDIFTTFPNLATNKPIRSTSLCSLKSLRKVKLSLQKAETSDDEDTSDNEEHDYTTKLIIGDSNDDGKSPLSHFNTPPKKLLGNITEETQD